jgi:hypothetical protein
MPRYRKEPLARLERSSRIYAPSPGEPPVPGGRRRLAPGRADLRHVLHGEAARAKARALDGFIGQSVAVREPHDAGRRTVERLAAHYVEDHLWGCRCAFGRNRPTCWYSPARRPHRHR